MSAGNISFRNSSLALLLALVGSAVSLCIPHNASAAALGVFQGNGCNGVTRLPTFNGWFGRKPNFVVDFLNHNTWQDMLDGATWTANCWASQNTRVVLSVPMLTSSGDTLADGANGKFDANFRQIATTLVQKGYGNAVIRLGWEFNGGWFAWAAKKDPTNWVKYWQRIVTVMRSVSGSGFSFDWCTSLGGQQIAPPDVYPGDAYVDIIGTDVYNASWITANNTPELRWNEYVTQAYGLTWLKDFAKLHNKPISIPEWGTGTRPDGHGGGDDPYFITQMAAWIKSNNVQYHGYWDYPASDYNAMLSDGHQPKAAAAFLTAFRSIPKAPGNVAASKVP